MADTVMPEAASPAGPINLRPKYKISELPLNKEQRTTIENLLYRFKKKGGYDSLRKKVWADYNVSDTKSTLTTSIQEVAEIEIDKQPSLLSRERGKAATLIQGAVDRSGVYHNVEVEMDRLMAEHLDTVLESVREIRKSDVGEEKATEEDGKGRKTDEQYTAETEAKGQAREQNRARMEELTRQTLELKAALKKKEEKKQRELQKKKDEEERKKRDEEDEKRRVEREKRREEERKAEEERIKEREERYRRREEERKERYREYDRERDRDRDYRSPAHRSRYADERRGSDAHTPKVKTEATEMEAPPLDEKALEAAALELLLNEGKQLEEKSKQNP